MVGAWKEMLGVVLAGVVAPLMERPAPGTRQRRREGGRAGEVGPRAIGTAGNRG